VRSSESLNFEVFDEPPAPELWGDEEVEGLESIVQLL